MASVQVLGDVFGDLGSEGFTDRKGGLALRAGDLPVIVPVIDGKLGCQLDGLLLF